MPDVLPMTISGGVVEALKDLVREAVRDELTLQISLHEEGFLDVGGAAAFLSSTETAIRSLVKRAAIPHYKSPHGRVLFDRDELRQWVAPGARKAA